MLDVTAYSERRLHAHRDDGRDGHHRPSDGSRRPALHPAGGEGEGGGRASPDRAPRHGARHLPARRGPLSEHAGGPRRAAPASLRHRPLGRALSQEGPPEGSLGAPVLLPQPRRGRPPVRPLLLRRRWGAGRRRRQPRHHELGRWHGMSRGARGFTLIEMAMVLLIIAIGSALVVPMIEGGFDSREVRRAARQLAATMHYCRGEAVALGKPQELVIVQATNTIQTTGGRSGVLSDRAVIEQIRGAFEPAPGVAQILFYPNGATTGADVSPISRRDWIEKGQANRILIHLDPLVGSVTVQ